ncbi:MAG: YCF48-related protein [Ignavibacteriae bacterium]|nr:YCF48-related protein [Ignavibacteriota bacterium]
MKVCKSSIPSLKISKYYFSRIILIVLFLMISNISSSQFLEWQLINKRMNLSQVYFINQNTGWVFSENYALHTTDGGEYWNRPINMLNVPLGENETINLLNVFYLDSNIAWAAKGGHWYYNYVMKSTNGGKNWMTVNINLPDYNYYNVIYFCNNNTGFIGGENHDYTGKIIKTTDGGYNWYYAYYPPTGNIISVDFINLKKGWIISSDGSIWKSVNGGYNWTIQYNGTFKSTSIKAIDSLNVLCTGWGGNIIKTSNGGLNWTDQNIGNNKLNSVIFINAYTGWIAGDSGTIKKTTNNGLNWSSYPLITLRKLNSVNFSNANTGIIAGDSGLILRTTNSGQNWPANIKSYFRPYK